MQIMIKVVRKRKSMAARFLEKQEIPLPFSLQNKRFVMVTMKKMCKLVIYFIFQLRRSQCSLLRERNKIYETTEKYYILKIIAKK